MQFVAAVEFSQRTLTVGGKDHSTAGLQFNKTGLVDQQRNMLFFVGSEAAKFKLVNLETSRVQ